MEQIKSLGATVLFGREQDIEQWSHALLHGSAHTETWTAGEGGELRLSETTPAGLAPSNAFPLALVRKSKVVPAHGASIVRAGDSVVFVVSDAETRAIEEDAHRGRGVRNEAAHLRQVENRS